MFGLFRKASRSVKTAVGHALPNILRGAIASTVVTGRMLNKDNKSREDEYRRLRAKLLSGRTVPKFREGITEMNNKIRLGFNRYLANKLDESKSKFGYHPDYDDSTRSKMTWDGDFHVSHNGVTVSQHETRNAAHEALLKHAAKHKRNPEHYMVSAMGWRGRISKQFDHEGKGYSWDEDQGTFMPDGHPDHKLDESNSPRTASIKADFHRRKAAETRGTAISKAGTIAKSKHGDDHWRSDSVADSFKDPEVKKLFRKSGQHAKAAEKADDIINAHRYGVHGTAMNRWGISTAKTVVNSIKGHLKNQGHKDEHIDGFIKSNTGRHFVNGMKNDASFSAADLDKNMKHYVRAQKQNRIDEISQHLRNKYIVKASNSRSKLNAYMGHIESNPGRDKELFSKKYDDMLRKDDNRQRGILRAVYYTGKNKKKNV